MACHNDMLIRSFKSIEKAVIVIDEARGLNPEGLACIRLLSHLERNRRDCFRSCHAASSTGMSCCFTL